MRYTIRNYNTFLRESKHRFDLTHKEAQELYRQVKPDLGRPPRGIDVSRHPRIIGRNVEIAKRIVTPPPPPPPPPPEPEDFFEEWAITFEY